MRELRERVHVPVEYRVYEFGIGHGLRVIPPDERMESRISRDSRAILEVQGYRTVTSPTRPPNSSRAVGRPGGGCHGASSMLMFSR